MRVDYRQGIVRYQTDSAGNPVFLQREGDGTVSLIVSPDTTLITMAHGFDTDYLHEEQQTITSAWNGPFTAGTDYWLYWDVNVQTGVRTFGQTTLEPVTGPTAPVGPANGQMWFDTSEFVMKEWIAPRWRTVVRLFSCKYNMAAVVEPFGLESQGALNVQAEAGFILFDENLDPVKRFDRFNRGTFHTTITPLSSQTAQQSNFRLEAAIVEAEAMEYIPKYHAVAYIELGKLGLARQNVPQFPAVGIAQDDFFVTQRRSFISRGHIRSRGFNFTQPVNTPLFVGLTGELTHIVPQAVSLQQVARVVSPHVIYVDVQPQIIYD